MSETTVVTIDPSRLAITVMASTMNIELASSACKRVSEWANGKPITVTFTDKAGRYSKGKHYRAAIVFDEEILKQLDAEIDQIINGA